MSEIRKKEEFEVEVLVRYGGGPDAGLDAKIRDAARRASACDVGSGYDFRTEERDFQFWVATHELAERLRDELSGGSCRIEIKPLREPSN